MTIKEKKEKRAGLITQMRALLNKAAADNNRDLNADEQTSYDNMEKEVDKLGREVTREENLAKHENHLRGQRDSNYRAGVAEGGEKRSRFAEGYRGALFNNANSYARLGRNGLTSEVVAVLSEGSDTEGGYYVPEEFELALVENLVNMDPIRAGATVLTPSHDRNIPVEADTGSFGYIGESGTYGTSDPSVGRVVLGAWKCGGIIKASEELVQDSGFDLEAYLLRLASRRYNAIEQTSFADGNGVGKPLGLFQTTAVAGVSVAGFQGATSATPAITGDDIIETFHKLPRAYRRAATWIAGDTTTKLVRKLKGEDNQYLWQPGLVGGQPDTVLGRPWEVSDGAPAPAASGKSIVFCDLSFYHIADRLGTQMQQLRELYAASGQVGFKFTRRHDGKLTQANALAYFQHGAAA